jgi:hypothetical protein
MFFLPSAYYRAVYNRDLIMDMSIEKSNPPN